METPIRMAGADARTLCTVAFRSRKLTFSAGASCSMLLLAPLLALVRVPIHELPIRESDAEQEACGRQPGPTPTFGTGVLREPVLRTERHLRQYITLPCHLTLRK